MTADMQSNEERNLGEQPLVRLMEEAGVTPRDLVAAAPAPITFKMVARARKGRRLTPRAQHKILEALNTAAGTSYRLGDCFTYGAP